MFSQKDTNEILDRSRNAFLQFRTIPGIKRAELLKAIAAGIEGSSAKLLPVAMRETNLPEPRLAGEVARTCNQLRQFADMLLEGSWVEARIDTALPDRQPVPKPDIRKMFIPLGPVIVFGASNFPFAYSTAGVDTASALAAGCTVVLKGHPAHPETSGAVAQLITAALVQVGLPTDVFIHVESPGFEVGRMLVQHPHTKAVGFTGSFSGGKALYDYAQQRKDPIPVFSEMGSINPVYLLPDALKSRAEQIAGQYAASVTLSVGQFCTNPGLLIGIKGPELDLFSQKLSEAIGKTPSAPMLHRGIADNYSKKRMEALSQKGVSLLGQPGATTDPNHGTPTLATVAGKDFLVNSVLLEEVFGPYSLLVQAADQHEMELIANSVQGQLTTSIIAEPTDWKQFDSLIQIASEKAGRVIFNGVPTGVEVCPAMHHGGPFPATTDARFSSVGIDAIKRFVRPLSLQNYPEELLPEELKTANPLGIWRLFNNQWKR